MFYLQLLEQTEALHVWPEGRSSLCSRTENGKKPTNLAASDKFP